MSSIKDYIKNEAKQNINILERIKRIQSDLASAVEDIEANAEGIQELAEIIGGEEQNG